MTELVGSVAFLIEADRAPFDTTLEEINDQPLGIALPLKVDARGIREQLRAMRLPNIKIGIDLSTVEIEGKLDRLMKGRSMKLTAFVNDQALTDLNKHLSLKERHFGQVNRLMKSNPLTPTIDVSGLDVLDRRLSGLERGRSVNVEIKTIGDVRLPVARRAAVETQQKLNTDTSDLEKSISGAINKGFKSAKRGNIGGLLTAPFKAAAGIVGGVGSTIASGLVLGATQEVSKNFGRGLSTALEGAIGGSVGSSELLAEKVGGSVASAFVGAFKSELESITNVVEAQIGKIKDPRKRKEAKETLANIRNIPAAVGQATVDTIGVGEIEREKLRRKSLRRRDRAMGDRAVNQQSDIDIVQAQRKLGTLTQSAPARKGQADQSIAAAEDRYAELLAQSKSLSDQVNNFSFKVDPLEAQFAAAEGKTIEAPEKAYQRLVEAYAQTTAQIKSAADGLAAARDQREQIDREIAEQSQIISRLQITTTPKPKLKGKALETAKDAALGRLREAQGQNQSISSRGSARVASIDAEIATAREAFKSKRSNFDKAAAEYDKFNATVNAEMMALREQIVKAGESGQSEQVLQLTTELEGLKSSPEIAAQYQALSDAKSAAQTPLQQTMQQITNLQSQKAIVEAAIAEAGAELATAQAELADLSKGPQLPKDYVKLAQAVAGKNVDTDRLPRLQVADQKLDELGANGAYNKTDNVILIRKTLAEALAKAEMSQEQILTLAEELSHAYDLDFGSAKGIEARQRGDVLPGRDVKATPAEVAAIAPDLAGYDEKNRPFELNGKVRAKRSAAKFEDEKRKEQRLGALTNVNKFLNKDELIGQYNNLYKTIEKFGGAIDEQVTAEVAAASAEIDRIMGQIASGQGDQNFQEMADLKPRIDALKQKINGQIESAIDAEKLRRAEARAVANPATETPTESRFGQRSTRKIGSRIKNLVMNPDREITIDTDKMRAGAAKVGRGAYQVGLATAKAADGATRTFTALANSDGGKAFIGSLSAATSTIGRVSRAGYQIASGMEAIALDMLPMGRSIKGVMKQTVVPALGFAAASQLPGGHMVAGALGHAAQGVAGPIGQSIAGHMSGGATEFISQAMPNAFGLQAQVTGAVTGAIESIVGTVTSGVAAAAVPVLGGKAMQAVGARALPKVQPIAAPALGGGRQRMALPEAVVANQPLNLPQTESPRELEPITIDTTPKQQNQRRMEAETSRPPLVVTSRKSSEDDDEIVLPTRKMSADKPAVATPGFSAKPRPVQLTPPEFKERAKSVVAQMKGFASKANELADSGDRDGATAEINKLKRFWGDFKAKLTPDAESVAGSPEEIAALKRSLGGSKGAISRVIKSAQEKIEAMISSVSATEAEIKSVPALSPVAVMPQALPTAPTPPPTAPTPQKSSVYDVSPNELNFDPKRFQYKMVHGGAEGASGSLNGVQKWDENLGGVIQVWKDPKDEKDYVVNGHNRGALAKRLGAESVTVRRIKADTAEEARSIGALTNIAEGRGNALDSAKFFRDSGLNREQLQARGIPMGEKIATDGIALANLAPNLFDSVVQGNLPQERAIAIGQRIPDHDEQNKLVKLIEHQQGKGRKITNDVVRELADTVASAPTQKGSQTTLFGTEEFTDNLAIEKAELMAAIRRRLGREKKLFGAVSKSKAAQDLTRGGNTINTEASADIASQADVMMRLFDQMKNQSGPIAGLLNEGTGRIGQGENLKQVQDEIYQRLLDEIPIALGLKQAPNQAPTEEPGMSLPGFARIKSAKPRRGIFRQLSDKIPKVASADIEGAIVNGAGNLGGMIGSKYGPDAQLGGMLGGAMAARQAIELTKAGKRAITQTRENGEPVGIRSIIGNTLRNFGRRDALMQNGAALNQDVAGLARVRDNKPKPGIFRAMRDRARAILPTSERGKARIAGNYAAIAEEIHNTSEAPQSFDKSTAPTLKVADKQLKKLGAEAFYDTEQNVILINKWLAAILQNSPEALKRYAEQLAPLVHEGRHGMQTMGGALGADIAATGAAVPLADGSRLTPAQKRQVDGSTAAYRGTAKRESVRRLEADAYDFERNTPGILARAGVRSQAMTDSLPNRPLNRFGRRLVDARDSIGNTAGNLYDNARLTIQGQRDLIPQARANRAQARRDRMVGRNASDAMNRADMAGAEASYQQTQAQAAETLRSGTEGLRDGQRVQRQVAKSIGEPSDADGQIILNDIESPKISYFGRIRDGLNAFNQGVSKRLAEQANILATDAQSTLQDIKTNRIEAQGKAIDNPAYGKRAKRLMALEERGEKAVSGIAKITAKETMSSKDRRQLQQLKDEIKSVYKEIGKPLPGGSDGLLSIGDRVLGVAGKFKLLGAALLGIPFAFAALNFLKDFAKASTEAAIKADRLQTSLNYSTGGKTQGATARAFAEGEIDRLGIARNSSLEGYAKLKASTKNTKSEGSANELFTGISSAATTLGLSGEDQNGVLNALSQISSKGSLQAEELRGQIGDRLPQAFRLAAEAMGATEAELGKLMETGQVTADEFLPKFARKLNQEFGGAAVEASGNLQSAFFRLEAANERLSESFGKTISPALMLGVNGLAAGLDSLAKNADKVAIAAIAAAIAFGGLGKVDLLAPIGKLGELAMGIKGANFGAILGQGAKMAGTLLLVAAAAEAVKGGMEAIMPDDLTKDFDAFADQGVKGLERIEKAADRAAGKMSKLTDKPKSKGVNLTLGIGGATGLFEDVKSDDVLLAARGESKNAGASQIVDNAMFGPLGFMVPDKIKQQIKTQGIDQARKLTGNSELLQTVGEKQQQDQIISADKGLTVAQQAASKVKDPRFEKALADTQKIDKEIAALEDKKRLLRQSASPNKSAIEAIDRQLNPLREKRTVAAGFAQETESTLGGLKSGAKAKLEAIDQLEKDGEISTVQAEKLRNTYKQIIAETEGAQAAAQKLNDTYASSALSASKIAIEFAKINTKTANLRERAELSQIKEETGLAQSRKKSFFKDENASLNAPVEAAKITLNRASRDKVAADNDVAEKSQLIESDAFKAKISGIPIGKTGETIGLDSSTAQIDEALKGLDKKTDAERIASLEQLKEFQASKKQQLEAGKAFHEAEFGMQEAAQQRALGALDKRQNQREQLLRGRSADRNIRINKGAIADFRNQEAIGEDTGVAQAIASKQAASDQLASAQQGLKELEALNKAGLISAEEYAKRRKDAEISIKEATAAEADARLNILKAEQARALALVDRANREREAIGQKRDNNTSKAIANQQIGDFRKGQFTGEDVAVAQAKQQAQSADTKVFTTTSALADLEKVKGQISGEEYRKRRIEGEVAISDATAKQAEARLNILKAEQAQALAYIDRSSKLRELAAKRVEVGGIVKLRRRQLAGTIAPEAVAAEEATLKQGTAKADLSNAEQQLSDLDRLVAEGRISAEEGAKQRIDLEGKVLGARVAAEDAALAKKEAVSRRELELIDRRLKRSRAVVDDAAFEGTFAAKSSQLGGVVVGQGGGAEADRVELNASKKRLGLFDDEAKALKSMRSRKLLSETEYEDRVTDLKGRRQSERMKALDLEIKAQERGITFASDAAKRGTDAVIAQVDREKAANENANKRLDERSKKLGLELELVKAIGDARSSGLQIGINRASEGEDMAKRLKEGGLNKKAKRVYRQELQELGFSGNGKTAFKQAFTRRQNLEGQADQTKLVNLAQQQTIERELLGMKLEQERLSAKIAENEAKRNLLAAQRAKIEADEAARKARLTGDQNEIANAEAGAKNAAQGVELAAQGVGLASEVSGGVDRQISMQAKTLKIKQGTEFGNLQAETQANARKRRRDRAEAGFNPVNQFGGGFGTSNIVPFARAATPLTDPTNTIKLNPYAMTNGAEARSEAITKATNLTAGSATADRAVASAGSNADVVAAVNALGSKIEKLASTPRSVSVTAADPVNDLPKVLEAQTRAIG